MRICGPSREPKPLNRCLYCSGLGQPPRMGKSEMLTIPSLHDSPFSWLELIFTVQFEDVPEFDNRDGESYAKARLDAFSGGEL